MRTVAMSFDLLLFLSSGCAAGCCVALVVDTVDLPHAAAQRAIAASGKRELTRAIGLAIVAQELAEHGGVTQEYGERAIGHQRAGETDHGPEHAGLGAIRGGRAAGQIFEQAAV